MPTQLFVQNINLGRLLQERTRNFVEGLRHPDAALPDVMFLQDVALRDLPLFERFRYQTSKAMTNHIINGVRAVVGIAIVSRFPFTDVDYCTTWGNGKLKDLEGVKDNKRHLGVESDRLVEATEDRVAIAATVVKDDVGFEVLTHHGMWVRDGVVNDQQRTSSASLINFAKERVFNCDGVVLIGDLNLGRGGEIYEMFRKAGFRDCIPPDIDNTLDPDHPVVKKGVRVVTDYLMILEDRTGHSLFPRPPSVSNVHLKSGVSDHCAVGATITRG